MNRFHLGQEVRYNHPVFGGMLVIILQFCSGPWQKALVDAGEHGYLGVNLSSLKA